MTIFRAKADGSFAGPGLLARCALGRAGVIAAPDKREGDGATPLGILPLRRVLFRPDRAAPPRTALPLAPIAPDDLWCDDPADPAYNQAVTHPYPARAERMWREDGLYDFVIVLGWNDAPIIPGRGSAIFWHLATPDFAPTAGCVATDRATILAALARAAPGDALEISA